MAPFPLILSVVALVLFIIASVPAVTPEAPRWMRLVSIGLAAWVAIVVLGYAGVPIR
jgi:hypothetical protein